MGTWGTGLSSNDTFADIYGEFFELYNEGQDAKEVTTKLLATNKELLTDKGDSNNFWFAIAKAQWECKSLDKEVYDRVKQIIENKEDLEVWRELGADDKDLAKREKALLKLLEQLGQKREKAKSRKKKKILNPIFEKGTCLTFKLFNGNFGAAVILEAIYDTPYGFNLVAVTDLNKKERPTTKDIIDSNVLKLNYATWDNKEQISWFIPNQFKKDSDKFEVVDKVPVNKTYDYKTDSFSSSGDWSIWIIEVASRQFEQGRKNLFDFGTKTKKYL